MRSGNLLDWVMEVNAERQPPPLAASERVAEQCSRLAHEGVLSPIQVCPSCLTAAPIDNLRECVSCGGLICGACGWCLQEGRRVTEGNHRHEGQQRVARASRIPGGTRAAAPERDAPWLGSRGRAAKPGDHGLPRPPERADEPG